MATTTISQKFQVVIPRDVREALHLKRGQKMTVVVKGGIVHLIPEKPLKAYRGFLKGMDTNNIREDEKGWCFLNSLVGKSWMFPNKE